MDFFFSKGHSCNTMPSLKLTAILLLKINGWLVQMIQMITCSQKKTCYQAGNCYDFHTTPWVPCNVIPGAQADVLMGLGNGGNPESVGKNVFFFKRFVNP